MIFLKSMWILLPVYKWVSMTTFCVIFVYLNSRACSNEAGMFYSWLQSFVAALADAKNFPFFAMNFCQNFGNCLATNTCQFIVRSTFVMNLWWENFFYKFLVNGKQKNNCQYKSYFIIWESTKEIANLSLPQSPKTGT